MPSIAPSSTHQTGYNVAGNGLFQTLENFPDDSRTPSRFTVGELGSIGENTNQETDPVAERERQEKYEEEWRVYLGLD
jgi:hypothetical protein